MKQQVYLGPTMATQGFVITTGTIFEGNLPAAINERLTTDTDFAALFVEPSNVGAARFDIRQGNSFLADCFNRVLTAYLNKEHK